MKQFIKGNIKLLIAFTLGLVIAGTTVYATAVLSGSDVSYSNESSKLISTNVQGAIDEIYNNMVPINLDILNTNTAKTIYASSKGICIKRNSKFNCFKINNWNVEKEHIQQVFSDVSCYTDPSYVHCSAFDFYCTVHSNGNVICTDDSDNSNCTVNSDSSVDCT